MGIFIVILAFVETILATMGYKELGNVLTFVVWAVVELIIFGIELKDRYK